MKTCHACGTKVDDKELVCPVCGATVVMATSGLSLKAEETVKMKSSPSMGKTVSTGSGLTDILRGEDDDYGDADDDSYVMGSIPTALSKNSVYDASDEEEKARRKRENHKVNSTIFKIVILGLVAFGIYYVVTNFILVERGAKSYEDALKIYVEAINDNDVDKMKEIVPLYYSNKADKAQEFIDYMKNVQFTASDIVDAKAIDEVRVGMIESDVKLRYNKTIYIEDAYTLTVEFKGSVTSDSGVVTDRGDKVEMEFFKAEGKWYFLPDTYENPTFTQ